MQRLFLRPEGRGVSVSCVWKYLTVIIGAEGKGTGTRDPLSSTLYLQLNHSTDIILPFFLYNSIHFHVKLGPVHLMTGFLPKAHCNNYSDRGWGAISTGNSRCP